MLLLLIRVRSERTCFFKHKFRLGEKKNPWYVLVKIYSYINLFPDCRFEVVWWSRRMEPDVLFHPTCVSNIYSMWMRDTEWFSHKMESLWLGYKCSLAHHHSSITFHSRAFPSSQSKVRAFPGRLHASLWQQNDRVALSRPRLLHAALIGKERAQWQPAHFELWVSGRAI